LDDALYFAGDARKLVLDDTRSFTASGQSYSYKVRTGTSTDTMNPFKVVLSYFDYPSALAPMDISVNNLNLTVQDSATGTIYLGNVFGTDGKSTTGGTADTINNDEIVWLLPSVAKGSRTMIITVTAATIIRSPQPYSLTVAGDLIRSTNFRYDIVPQAVELASFTALAADGGVEISWSTSSERECLRWEIERSQQESEGYAVIGTVAGNLTSNEPHYYKYTDRSELESGAYYYRLAEVDVNGNRSLYGPHLVEVGGRELPAASFLGRAYPNPATKTATISYGLRQGGATSLKIYNVLGQEVRTLVSGHQAAGHYTQAWDGRDNQGQTASNGVYLYQLISGEFSATKKLTLIR
jgi:hypothetical protein